eukprot:1945576-Rhodomonas_salina.10
MPGTDLEYPTFLRARSILPGTDLAYGATSARSYAGTPPSIVLHPCYAMSGSYGAWQVSGKSRGSSCSAKSTAFSLPCVPGTCAIAFVSAPRHAAADLAFRRSQRQGRTAAQPGARRGRGCGDVSGPRMDRSRFCGSVSAVARTLRHQVPKPARPVQFVPGAR